MQSKSQPHSSSQLRVQRRKHVLAGGVGDLAAQEHVQDGPGLKVLDEPCAPQAPVGLDQGVRAIQEQRRRDLHVAARHRLEERGLPDGVLLVGLAASLEATKNLGEVLAPYRLQQRATARREVHVARGRMSARLDAPRAGRTTLLAGVALDGREDLLDARHLRLLLRHEQCPRSWIRLPESTRLLLRRKQALGPGIQSPERIYLLHGRQSLSLLLRCGRSLRPGIQAPVRRRLRRQLLLLLHCWQWPCRSCQHPEWKPPRPVDLRRGDRRGGPRRLPRLRGASARPPPAGARRRRRGQRRHVLLADALRLIHIPGVPAQALQCP
mmetsp:Transcript_140972/g.438257  ORF Transcript_140972/g.438257 Transcript_140972/m.438257 type:complete len:324 (-) Transcript_140972:190-1161(-)